ncbi:MAG TPA: polysaccharide biosynthesis/export family protein [Chthoniobacteraceae bacterium]|nr:polysaccharide biosynthesis/export family protein [Chthoniobacteraceae bacterium]
MRNPLLFFAVVLFFGQSVLVAQTVRRATAAPPSETAPDLSETARFRPGDSFEISLGAVPPETGDAQAFQKIYTIGGDGTINVPFAGMVRAAGLTQSQLEKAIQQRLIDGKIYRWPTITINVPEKARLITVGGQVRQPQRTYWSADMTLMSAINAAGGPADFAGDKVRLTRKQKVTVYSRKKLIKNPQDDPSLFPGDQIELL